MIGLLLLLVLIMVLAVVVPTIAAAVARNVASNMNRGPSSGSIDQSLVEARLTRIEEAIDAMAVQIERLSDHQRALLGRETNVDREP